MDSEKSKKEWSLYGREEGGEYIGRLVLIVGKGLVDDIALFYKNTKAIRTLIAWRGAEGEYLRLLLDGLAVMLRSGAGIELSRSEGGKIVGFLMEKDIPIFSLCLCGDAAYHLRDEIAFDACIGSVLDHRDQSGDVAYFRAMHALATWTEMVIGDSSESIRLNKQVIANLQAVDPVYALKAKVGLSYSKELSPRDKVHDFLRFSEEFKKLGNDYESFRSHVEAARSLYQLAISQGLTGLAFENMERAKLIVLDSLRAAKDIGYQNLEIIAREVLSDIYEGRRARTDELGRSLEKGSLNRVSYDLYESLAKVVKQDSVKAKKLSVKTDELRRQYRYDTRVKLK